MSDEEIRAAGIDKSVKKDGTGCRPVLFDGYKEVPMDNIRLDGIVKGYPDHPVLCDLSLSIKKGECFTLLGPSGCGKTVLLRLIAGFESPEAGRIYIDDTPVYDAADGVSTLKV